MNQGTEGEERRPPKIRWAPRLRPSLLRRLYEADAAGLRDMELCDKVGTTLYCRCRTFVLVEQGEVECPLCRTAFPVAHLGTSRCPGDGCDWTTTRDVYRQSIHNHSANTGRAMDAVWDFYRRYPHARTYADKIVLIDQLIHSFHIDEKTGLPVKSIASQLFEGNKKAVVRFLDDLSARDPAEKERWRRTVATTIDWHIVQPNRDEG